MRAILAFSLLLISAPPAIAQTDLCRSGFFPSEQEHLGLAIATGASRTWLLRDYGGCPQKVASCRHGYVVSGQTVLTGKSQGGYVCAFYPGNRTETAGWIPDSQLQPIKVDLSPPLAAWAGKWTDGFDHIQITLRGKKLQSTGDAIWQGAYSTHTGDMGGVAAPAGNHVVFKDEDPDDDDPNPDVCTVKATLVGKYLVVSDNGLCGGMNVRFDAVYHRQP